MRLPEWQTNVWRVEELGAESRIQTGVRSSQNPLGFCLALRYPRTWHTSRQSSGL